jgi:hypothetical protein
MKKLLVLSSFVLAVTIVLMGFSPQSQDEKHPDVDWSLSCQECHANVTPEVYKQWENSAHGQVDFGCYICHGDGQEEFHPKGQDVGCQGCHAEQLVDFEKTKFSSCYDCHQGHTLKFHN